MEKYLSSFCGTVLIAQALFLSGCSMDYEEYESRVRYCDRKGLEAHTLRLQGGYVRGVVCVTPDGSKFESEETR